MSEIHDVIIIGSGPAGYTAAIYAARASLNPIVFEGALDSGGALMNTTEVENYPGFAEGIDGPDLMMEMRKQAERFGATLITDDVTAVELTGEVKVVKDSDDKEYRAKTVVLAMGSGYRRLGVEGEDRLSGRGVSWCATCDGAFFRDKPIAVIGGGDSAMEEATFLTKFAKSVTIVHRREEFRASAIMLERAKNNDKIRFATNKTVERVVGEGSVAALELKDTVTGETSELPVTAMFVAIGHDPRSQMVAGQIDLDESGYVKVDSPSTRTSLPGVFAAGDLVDSHYQQAISAAGTGCTAAIDAEHYLAALG